MRAHFVCLSTAIALVLIARNLLLKKMESEVLDIAKLEILELKHTQSIRLECLDFGRGDFLLEIHEPPLTALRFTINRYSSEVIAWDSTQKRKSFTRKLFQRSNF